MARPLALIILVFLSLPAPLQANPCGGTLIADYQGILKPLGEIYYERGLKFWRDNWSAGDIKITGLLKADYETRRMSLYLRSWDKSVWLFPDTAGTGCIQIGKLKGGRTPDQPEPKDKHLLKELAKEISIGVAGHLLVRLLVGG